MKQSNYIPHPKGLTASQKQLIESYFWGENSNKLKDEKGVVLNKNWQISQLTGIKEHTINRYINILINEKRKKMDD